MVKITLEFNRKEKISCYVSDHLFWGILRQLEDLEPVEGLADFQKAHYERVLETTASFKEAARTLGVHANTLWEKRQKGLVEWSD